MFSERALFPVMEEFGFFSHIYERLPEDFTAIFEIARVLEDEMSALSKQIREVVRLPAAGDSQKRDKAEDFHRYTPAGDRYSADLITSYHDVARIYPNQFLLPDEVFMQRLALRELWMPVARTGVILPVDDTSEGFTFDSRKQKVYILFDTSQSMSAHHRIHLAKAVLYVFLKRNKAELGHISLRTFDEEVGDVHTAVDELSYQALMRYVLRVTHLGEGTVLQKALMTALEDIQQMEHLSGAEILIITDGAVQLDMELLRSRMDEHTLIHAVKIGHVETYASEAQIDDMIVRGQIKDRALVDLQKQKSEIEHQLRVTEGAARRHQLEQMLAGVRRQIGLHKVAFGHELEQLSTVYVNIDDLVETGLFLATPETIGDLEELARALAAEAEEFLTPELTKKVAVLYDHLQFLERYETDPELAARLKAIDERLRKLLAHVLGDASEQVEGEAANGAVQSQAAALPMSEEDEQDLRFLLEAGAAIGRNWGLLLRWLLQRTRIGARAMARRLRIRR
ncbi:MAG: VWA domain-containing protein [Bacteroidota bacterium]|nr:VWA domain-containing protein [Bacteroidota bacterium]MDP4234310.1 VWA domain-containing protein [Bacteroidota bacterium]MDP4288049.1 VWA domain-containing protein [Bacteroidota bacterium]